MYTQLYVYLQTFSRMHEIIVVRTASVPDYSDYQDPKILDMIQKHTHTIKLTMYTRARTHTTMASSGNDQIYN